MSETIEVTEFLAQLVEKTGDGVIIATTDGTILAWSAGAARIFGWTPEQAVGENIDMLVPDNQKDQHWEGYDRVLASGETQYSGEVLLSASALKADGSRVGVEMSFTPLERGGEVAAIAAIIRPVRRTTRNQG